MPLLFVVEKNQLPLIHVTDPWSKTKANTEEEIIMNTGEKVYILKQ